MEWLRALLLNDLNAVSVWDIRLTPSESLFACLWVCDDSIVTSNRRVRRCNWELLIRLRVCENDAILPWLRSSACCLSASRLNVCMPGGGVIILSLADGGWVLRG